MKYTILNILALFIFSISQAQTWQRLIENPFNFGGAEAYGIIEIEDTLYVSSVFVVTDTISNNRAVISKHSIIDGEMLTNQQFRDDTIQNSMFNDLGTGYNQFYQTADTNFYMSIPPWNDNEPVSIRTKLLVIDKSLDILQEFPVSGFDNDILQNFNGTRIDPDGNILLYGSRSRLGQYFELDSANTLLVKMTPQGEQLWTRRYDHCYTINYLAALSDGDIVINAGEVGTNVSERYIIKTDTDGIEQWRMHYGGVFTGNKAAMTESLDEKIIIANSWNLSSNPNVPNSDWIYQSWIQVQEIQDLGESYTVEQDLKYHLTLPIQEVYGIEQLPSHDYITWGITTSTSGDTFDVVNQIYTKPFTRAFLFKLDENLDSLWLRTYYHPDDDILQSYSQYRFSDVTPLADGGFATCGWGRVHSLQNLEQVWLTRLDEYGCLEPGCQNISVNEIAIGLENTMTAFPNPSNGQFTLQWSLASNAPSNVNHDQTTLIITDLQGREVKRLAINNFGKDLQMSIDLSDQPSGVYQVHWVKGAMWLDTIQLMKE
jgi:hypothetical protein